MTALKENKGTGATRSVATVERSIQHVMYFLLPVQNTHQDAYLKSFSNPSHEQI